MSCWTDPPEEIPEQDCEGPHTVVIDYLDKLVMRRPLHKAWDEFAWQEPPIMPTSDIGLTYIVGCMVEMGVHMLPVWFHINDEAGGFLGYAGGLLFEGTILAYDPSTNKAEWIPMCGSVKTLTATEQASVTDLCNMVPCPGSPIWGGGSLPGPSLWLRKFAEHGENRRSIDRDVTMAMEEDIMEVIEDLMPSL